MRGVFSDFDSAAENLARRIQQDDFDIFARAGILDAFGKLAEHRFVQQIVLGAVERHVRDASVQQHSHIFIIFDFFPLLLRHKFFWINCFDHYGLRDMNWNNSGTLCSGYFVMLARRFAPFCCGANDGAQRVCRP